MELYATPIEKLVNIIYIHFVSLCDLSSRHSGNFQSKLAGIILISLKHLRFVLSMFVCRDIVLLYKVYDILSLNLEFASTTLDAIGISMQ